MLTDDNKAFILRKINEGIQDYVVLANLVFNRETGYAKPNADWETEDLF